MSLVLTSIDNAVRRKGGQMQVTCSVSRAITTTQASQRADTDTAPHAGSRAGRCRFPLMMLAKSKQPARCWTEASLPERESNAPADIQYHRITTTRKAPHAAIAPLGLFSRSLR